MPFSIKAAKRFLSCEVGTPALEFAIIAPLFFATVMITFDLGRALYAYNKVSAAVSLGARTITIDGPDDEAAISNAILSRFDDEELGDITITMTEQFMASQIFKTIKVEYEFHSLIDYGPMINDVTLTVSRFSRAGDCTDAINVATSVYSACQSLGLPGGASVIDKGGGYE